VGEARLTGIGSDATYPPPLTPSRKGRGDEIGHEGASPERGKLTNEKQH